MQNPWGGVAGPGVLYLLKNCFYLACVRVCGGQRTICRKKLALTFYHVGSWNRTQAVRLGNKRPYLLRQLPDPGAVLKRPQVIPPHTKVKPHWQHTVPKCSNPSTAASHRTWKVVTNCRTLIGNQSPADSNAHNDCRNGCSGIHKKNMTDMLILLCSYRKQLGYKTTVANCDRVPSEFPFKLRRPHFGETCCVYHLSELAVPRRGPSTLLWTPWVLNKCLLAA